MHVFLVNIIDLINCKTCDKFFNFVMMYRFSL